MTNDVLVAITREWPIFYIFSLLVVPVFINFEFVRQLNRISDSYGDNIVKFLPQ